MVLLHAFPLHSGMWEPQLHVLSPRWQVVAPDLKGFGGSDAPEDPSAYSMEDYADEVAALLDELGLGPVVLVGLSMGGYVAFAFLRRHRHRLAALVLADTRPEADAPEVLERRTNQQRQVADEGTTGVIEALVAGLLSEHTRTEKPAVVEQVRGLMDNPPAGFVGALAAMKRRTDATAELDAIDVPTLVVVGEEDGVSPPSVAEAMCQRIPRCRLATLPRAGHLSNLDAPEAFNEVLLSFLADL